MEPVGDSSEILLRLMTASTLRAKVLSENIAHQNVPGYKRKDVRFEEFLAERMGRGARSLDDVEPVIVTDYTSPASPDGNNVNIERETASMKENALLFESYAAVLQMKNELLRASIVEGR